LDKGSSHNRMCVICDAFISIEFKDSREVEDFCFKLVYGLLSLGKGLI